MAGRIRTIKPEFWTDSKVVGLSAFARLLCIGIWNFVDDSGVIAADPIQMKLQILPADPVDVAGLVDELVSAGMLLPATATDGTDVLVVRRWAAHQRINRPSAPRHGSPADFTYHGAANEPPMSRHGALSEDSVSPQTSRSEPVHGGLTEPSCPEGKGMEGEGNGKENPSATSADADDRTGPPDPDDQPPVEGDVDEALVQFEDHFWPAYPSRRGRKVGKSNALIEWRKLTIEQRRRAVKGARHLAASDELPKDAERFLRRAKGGRGDFPFDDWQEPQAAQGRPAHATSDVGFDDPERFDPSKWD